MLFTVAKNALLPADDEARARLALAKIGDSLEAQIPNPRNKVFANCTALAFSRLADIKQVDQHTIRGILALVTGRYEVIGFRGRAYQIPRGTGARDMTQAEYEVFWEDAVPIITADFLPY